MKPAEMKAQLEQTTSQMISKVGGEDSRYASKIREEMSGCLATIERWEQGIVGEQFAASKIAEVTQFTNRIIDRLLNSK